MAKFTETQRAELLRNLNKVVTKESADKFKLNKKACLETKRTTIHYTRVDDEGNNYTTSISPWRASYITYNKLDELDDEIQIRRDCKNTRCIHPKHLREVDTQGSAHSGSLDNFFSEIDAEPEDKEDDEYIAFISTTLLRGLVAGGFADDIPEIWPESGLEDWEYLMHQEEHKTFDEFKQAIRTEDKQIGADFATKPRGELISIYFSEFLLEMESTLRKQTEDLIEETLDKRSISFDQ